MSVSVSASHPSVGVWLIGARGSAATATAVAGCAAVTAGPHAPTGMVTETPLFADTGLPPRASLVFGGHDTTDCTLPKRAEALAAAGVLPYDLPAAITSELVAASAAIDYRAPTVVELPRHSHAGPHFAGQSLSFLRRTAGRSTDHATPSRHDGTLPPRPGDGTGPAEPDRTPGDSDDQVRATAGGPTAPPPSPNGSTT